MNSYRIISFFRISVLVLLYLMIASHHSLWAQDMIIIQRDGGKEINRSGIIVDWQGSKVSLAGNNGRTRTIDASEIKQINTAWPKELDAARQLVKQKDLAAAAATYKQAMSSESRPWVKAIVGSELLQVYDASENHKQAISEFIRIYVADNSTRFFKLIPLAWSAGEQNVPAAAELQRWLGNDNAILRLIASSWLLSRGNNDAAVTELEKLTGDTDKRIAQLALAQLWRTRLLAATQTDVQRWQRQIENIRPELRAGPWFVLAQAQSRIGQQEAAQINLMKVRILHPDKKTLSACALYLCGNIMSDLGLTDRAKAIWRELFAEFPASQFSALAGNKM